MTTTSRGSSRAQIMPRAQVGGRVVGMSGFLIVSIIDHWWQILAIPNIGSDSMNLTFQTMHHNIQLSLREQRFELFSPDAFGIEGREGFDLVFVGHCADDCRDIFDVGGCQV